MKTKDRTNRDDTTELDIFLAQIIPCKIKIQMDRARNGGRYFRNPPQPHMCIQDFIEGYDQPCYINVMSWVKILTPRRPEDPIPLYGGMRIPHNSAGSHKVYKKHPLIFAVMANPEILRISGKTAQDPADRETLIEVMLDFVEAMNPDIRFKRHASILHDRDLTGELKDIWLAVHQKREKERADGGKSSRYDSAHESGWMYVAHVTDVSNVNQNLSVHESNGEKVLDKSVNSNQIIDSVSSLQASERSEKESKNDSLVISTNTSVPSSSVKQNYTSEAEFCIPIRSDEKIGYGNQTEVVQLDHDYEVVKTFHEVNSSAGKIKGHVASNVLNSNITTRENNSQEVCSSLPNKLPLNCNKVNTNKNICEVGSEEANSDNDSNISNKITFVSIEKQFVTSDNQPSMESTKTSAGVAVP